MYTPEVVGKVIRVDVRKSEKLGPDGQKKPSFNATVSLIVDARDGRPDVFGLGLNLDESGKVPFSEGDTVSFLIQSMEQTKYGLKVFSSWRDCRVVTVGKK